MYLFVGNFFEIYPCGHIYQWLLLLFSHLVMPNYLQTHGLQHAELCCSSLSPIVCSNSCPLNNHGNFYISIIVHILLTKCCCSVTQSCPTLWNPMDCSTPGLPEFCHLLELAQIHVHWLVMPYNHLICSSLLLLPSIFPRIRVFFPNESALHIVWPKYWSFSISPSNEYSGFMIDCFDFLAVQRTLNSLLQHQSSKASIR